MPNLYSIFQVRATKDVAAHVEVLRGGEERARAGGRARTEGAPVQSSGKLSSFQ